jgi:hypothetical protein
MKKTTKELPFGTKISRNRDLDCMLLDKDCWTLHAIRQVLGTVIEELEILHERIDVVSAQTDAEFERVYSSLNAIE